MHMLPYGMHMLPYGMHAPVHGCCSSHEPLVFCLLPAPALQAQVVSADVYCCCIVVPKVSTRFVAHTQVHVDQHRTHPGPEGRTPHVVHLFNVARTQALRAAPQARGTHPG
jgi:hypothetical protein